MCDRCVENLKVLPPELLPLLEKHRAKITKLIEEMDTDLAEIIAEAKISDDASPEELVFAQQQILNTNKALSLIGVVAYAIAANNHDPYIVEDLIHATGQMAMVGHYKFGEEAFLRKLN
ncbi:hypothetical protein Ab1vBOLIVR2_gp39 [Agrobacterium phage OLIVR2]|uniref:Uncharacterized protein n=1 Tax=Agrobacterium phage OLIVR1 TaxID=2723769 RepID=A0A858MR26_9CAUD|nr:hypothetical protein [Xanthomonas campestris]YP_010107073.1 hypothetical protein KNU98_gp070 [Agrobacterium phage OLIVR1]QIW87342.1 hypothetical protein Ab1vBOLIVR2_gp39 [Agrobacterium phage OLIVR2]QIW87449.1 hypothetical protein Ab1vBOLIVR3_gp39 [Agrobacterium phage OLIVR3]MCF8861630.1 hypothetical protein [Xanthomonas campestris pv. campestris]QIW87234.1 hypothetical protein Ab1vBOLIVR1_gp39 [Agrobacterium phage OLIVR1]